VVGSSFAPSQPTACPSAAVALLAAPPAALLASVLCANLDWLISWCAPCAVRDQTGSGLRGLACTPAGRTVGVSAGAGVLSLPKTGTTESLS